MKPKRLPLPTHPLTKFFLPTMESLTTSLGNASVTSYRGTVHVPLGKLKTERWVPVDSMVCQLVERILALRPPTAPHAGRLLLFRPRGRVMLIRRLRATLRDVAAAAGITARIFPHQFRHTYGTEMLRAGCRLCRHHATPRPQEPAHDLAVSRNHPTGSAARIPLGPLSPQTFGAPPKRCRQPCPPPSRSPCQSYCQDPR
jgi:Phage integrase family